VGEKWHPDEGIPWRDDLLEVFILTIGKVTSLDDNRLTSTIVEIDDSYPQDHSFKGNAHQLTISGEMVSGNELTPPFTSQASPSWPFFQLNLVCSPVSPKLHTISL
jgi:hypothetical protein